MLVKCSEPEFLICFIGVSQILDRKTQHTVRAVYTVSIVKLKSIYCVELCFNEEGKDTLPQCQDLVKLLRGKNDSHVDQQSGFWCSAPQRIHALSPLS